MPDEPDMPGAGRGRHADESAERTHLDRRDDGAAWRGDPVVAADELRERLPTATAAEVSALLAECGDRLVELLDELHRRAALSLLLQHHTLSLLQAVAQADVIAAVFRCIAAAGLYESMCAGLPPPGHGADDLLRRWWRARPSFDEEALNRAALARWQDSPADEYAFDALIVPGFTPLAATRPLGVAELLPAQRRLELALHLHRHATAPVIIVTGGAVHPPGTPINEALSMRDYLLDSGLSADQILVEPYARHTTTNVRNAGRILRQHKRLRGLLISGFDSPIFGQDFYLSHPTLSSFYERCRRELGYSPGELSLYAERQIAYLPSPAVDTLNLADPWDA